MSRTGDRNGERSDPGRPHGRRVVGWALAPLPSRTVPRRGVASRPPAPTRTERARIARRRSRGRLPYRLAHRNRRPKKSESLTLSAVCGVVTIVSHRPTGGFVQNDELPLTGYQSAGNITPVVGGAKGMPFGSPTTSLQALLFVRRVARTGRTSDEARNRDACRWAPARRARCHPACDTGRDNIGGSHCSRRPARRRPFRQPHTRREVASMAASAGICNPP